MPRKSTVFDKDSDKIYKLSRTKIELFVKCPRCFYLDQKLGIKRPSGYPFTLNNAVDSLLKREFDVLRKNGKQHVCQIGTDLIPAEHHELETWRNQFSGIKYETQGFGLFGGLDDLWFNKKTQEYVVVDYKATSNKLKPVLTAEWQDAYKRQMEVYQYLLSRNGLNVSKTGYFLYCNANAELESFNAELKFDLHLLPYTGSWDWIEPTITKIRELLSQETTPDFKDNCDYCKYIVKLGGLR